MTQVEFSKLLGVGEKTFARYETGQTVQSIAMNNLLRVIKAYPFVIDAIQKPVSNKRAENFYNPVVRKSGGELDWRRMVYDHFFQTVKIKPEESSLITSERWSDSNFQVTDVFSASIPVYPKVALKKKTELISPQLKYLKYEEIQTIN